MTIWNRLHGIETNEPSRMEKRRRGGGNQGRKHGPSWASDTLRRQPEQSDPPEGDQPPISTLRMGRGPRLRGGRPEQPMPKSYSSPPSCIPVQYPRRTRSPGRFYEARRPLLWSMRNCSKNAPGDTSRRYPICVSFRGGTEKVGSGRRDLVIYLVSPRPDSSIWDFHDDQKAIALSIGGGLVMETEMNEYSTFDQ
jgi:hypothetical protein